MIVQTAQAAAQEAQNHVGQALLGATGGSFVFGLAIEEVNKYLQAGAFCVTMLTGICAAVYYVSKAYEVYAARKKEKAREDR